MGKGCLDILALAVFEQRVNTRDMIKIKSGRVTVLGSESLKVSTRNSGVQTLTKRLDIRPSLNSEAPSPELLPRPNTSSPVRIPSEYPLNLRLDTSLGKGSPQDSSM